ncbi:MAG TPA: hypothetical protein VHZ31_06075 [Solirubrobacteraceae bacterium]|jgi:hypothetical protein|nr:hypothetical protein [Solirubrobacteraceae bacterium]
MKPKRIVVIAVSGTLLAGGTGAALAAVTQSNGSKNQQAVLADAAQRLGTTPDKLHDALAAAQDAQLDQQVKDGKLTQQQADAIKAQRKQTGQVLGGGGGFGGGPRGAGPKGFGGPGHGFRGGGRGFGGGFGMGGGMDLAKALGLTQKQLGDQLRGGKSLADIAKAQGKSLDDVRTALKADAKTRSDAAVKAGKLTQAQADKFLAGMDKGIDLIGTTPKMGPGAKGMGGGPGFFFHRGGPHNGNGKPGAKPATPPSTGTSTSTTPQATTPPPSTTTTTTPSTTTTP